LHDLNSLADRQYKIAQLYYRWIFEATQRSVLPAHIPYPIEFGRVGIYTHVVPMQPPTPEPLQLSRTPPSPNKLLRSEVETMIPRRLTPTIISSTSTASSLAAAT